MQSSAICQASPFGDWAKEDKLLKASVFGFRGWQVNPNLIFGDGEIRRRPQMEVWFCPHRVADLQGLTPEVRQRCFARMKQEKFINMEAGAVGSHLAAMDVVRRNALPKLTDKMPNLVVVVDDLNVTPVGLPALPQFVAHEFANPD